MYKIKKLLISTAAFFAVAIPLAIAPAAMAATTTCTAGSGDACIQASLCQGSTLKAPDPGTTVSTNNCDAQSTNSVNDLIATVINVFSFVVGVVAVIMIIIGGFRYITSGGDSASVSAAKNTILYAIIGLVIVAFAQFIVHFVLSRATNSAS